MSKVRNCSQKEMAVANAAPRYPNSAPQEAVRAGDGRGGLVGMGGHGALLAYHRVQSLGQKNAEGEGGIRPQGAPHTDCHCILQLTYLLLCSTCSQC